MKRQRPLPSSPSITTATGEPILSKITSTNSTISSYYSSKKPRKALISDLKTPKRVTLNLNKSELFLPLTFPTGQTFRWKQTSPFQYTGVVGSHLVSLIQLQDANGTDVAYTFHNTPSSDQTAAKSALLDFLNMSICLNDLWNEFSASDQRFAELAEHLSGARVLRQDPLECLIQFICSSNNNIKRITQMVDFISSLGNHLGVVEGIEFYEFPSLDQLSKVSEEELRKAGFGYRLDFHSH